MQISKIRSAQTRSILSIMVSVVVIAVVFISISKIFINKPIVNMASAQEEINSSVNSIYVLMAISLAVLIVLSTLIILKLMPKCPNCRHIIFVTHNKLLADTRKCINCHKNIIDSQP